jgi:hypothetical protein
MSGAIIPLPLYAFMAWCTVKKSTGIALPVKVTHVAKHTRGVEVKLQYS